MIIIPMTTAAVQEYLNLKNAGAKQIEKYSKAALRYLRGYTMPECYQAVTEEGTSADEDLQDCFKIAYAKIVFVKILPYLNLNTSGDGLLRSTGFNDSAEKLLSNQEISILQASQETEALEAIKEYLNDDGIRLLNRYDTNSNKGKTILCQLI